MPGPGHDQDLTVEEVRYWVRSCAEPSIASAPKRLAYIERESGFSWNILAGRRWLTH